MFGVSASTKLRKGMLKVGHGVLVGRRSSLAAVRLSSRLISSSCLEWPLSTDAFHGDSPNRFSEKLHDIEAHWKSELTNAVSIASPSAPSQYVLPMFPYPSGNLHMGHMRVYTISDVSARYYRLNGYNVVHPIGWDSFGLPAENAARDRGVDPREWTQSNIATMKDQLLRTGVQFDWDREISTCEPSFYRWTQWIFCRLHERGLLRRNLAEVNWDPVDGTVLAAEQIDADGRSWRSGAVAEKRKLRQWMVDTPRYAKRLSDGLRHVSQWHDVADIQSNWIGPCDVTRFLFPLRDSSLAPLEELLDLRVQDPLSVATGWFVVIRQGHALSDSTRNNIQQPYLLSSSVLNGVTGEWMSVVVVPADYEGPPMHLNARLGCSVADAGLVNSFGLKPSRKTMPMNSNDVHEIAAFGGFGGYETSRTLQDWVVSRQRAWGTPIPMLLSEDGSSAALLDDRQLPLIQGTTAQRTKLPCEKLPDGYGYYETDTLDTFFDSAWYYLRYLNPHNEKALISKEAAKNMPVNLYVGGIEHAAVHMFFARFISHFLTDIGVTSVAEPFQHLIPQGIVRGKTYVNAETGKYIRNDEVQMKDDVPVSPEGRPLNVVFEKMSKSKHNGVDPLVVLSRDGVDLARLQLLDAAAPRAPINWGDADQKGLRKWLDRISWVVSSYVTQRQWAEAGSSTPPIDAAEEDQLKETYNYFVRNVSMCLEVLHLHNTSLARLQGMTNALRKMDPSLFGSSVQAERCLYALITMLQVFAPHSAAELWSGIQTVKPVGQQERSTSIAKQPWPVVDTDCDIDFALIPLSFEVNDVNCGRIGVARQMIEGLSIDDVRSRARDQEHRDILEKLEQHGHRIETAVMSQRDGFHVTLTCTLKGSVDPKIVSTLLDEVQMERRRKAKPGKKNKKK